MHRPDWPVHLCEKKNNNNSHRRRADERQRQEYQRCQDYYNVIPILPQTSEKTSHVPRCVMDVKDIKQLAAMYKFPVILHNQRKPNGLD